MGWESIAVVGFDLGPLLQGQTRMLITRLLLVLELWNGKPKSRKSWAGNLWPLFQGQMRIAKISVYILLIRIPRGLQCHTNL